MISRPKIVENQCGSSDMIQSTDAKVTSGREQQPGRADLRKRTLSAGVVACPRSCSADQLLSRTISSIQNAK